MKSFKLLALLTLLFTFQKSFGQLEKPNILLVLVDDMGYGDLSCYGSTQIKTPHIDRLAADGIKFSQGYVSSTVCAPSRAGLLTGRFQNRFGFETNIIDPPPFVSDEGMGIPRQERLIPQYLKAAGYRTGIIGKWHVGENADYHHPNQRGFDYFFGMLGGQHNYFTTPEKNKLLRNSEKVTKIEVPYITDWFTHEAIQFIDLADEEPWFLYLAYNTPHTPLQAKAEDLAYFGHIEDEQRRTYLAMQRNLDLNIGKLHKFLYKKGVLENTLIVFLSDNGGAVFVNGAINAPLRGKKGMMLEGGIRVPFIMSWPARLPKGSEYHHPVSSLDLLPTFLDAANIPVADQVQEYALDGANLLPYLRKMGNEPPNRTLYWRMLMRGSAVLDDGWKLVRTPFGRTELYYLPDDISELYNLAQKFPEKVDTLLTKFSDWEIEKTTTPIWLGEMIWMKKTRELYNTEFPIEQPPN